MHNTPPRECITARRLAASVHVASADEAAQQLEQIPGSGAVSSPDAPAGASGLETAPDMVVQQQHVRCSA